MTPEQRLAQLGLTLPEPSTPVANYVAYRWADNLLYLSGQGPKLPDGTYRKGRLGRDASVEDGYAEARLTGLQLLAVLLGLAIILIDFVDDSQQFFGPLRKRLFGHHQVRHHQYVADHHGIFP